MTDGSGSAELGLNKKETLLNEIKHEPIFSVYKF